MAAVGATYDRDDLVQFLRRMADRLGRSPNISDLASRREQPSIQTFRSYFGSWPNALYAAGLPTRRRKRRPRLVLEPVRALARRLGRPPTYNDLAAATSPQQAQIVLRLFGSWEELIAAARMRPARAIRRASQIPFELKEKLLAEDVRRYHAARARSARTRRRR